MAAFYHRLRSSPVSPKPSRLERRRDRQIGLAFGIDHKEAVRSLAHAGRLNALQRPADHVQHAPLAAVHGRKTIGNSGLAHLLRGGFGGQAQLLGAQSLEVAGVKADHVMLVMVEAQHLRGQCLESTQQLAVVLDHQWHIGAGQFNGDLPWCSAFAFARAVTRADAVFQAQPAQLVQGIQESGNFLCRLLQVVNGHNK